ncbi:hypothetical protein ACLHDG_09000 [Sulfurovum sp. CS9]
MTKEEREYMKKLELSNELLKERIKYLEYRLQYEDPVKAVTKPSDGILF